MVTWDAPGHQGVKFTVEPVSAFGAHIQEAYALAPLSSIWAWTASQAAIHCAGCRAPVRSCPCCPRPRGTGPRR
jgi:hypothetical protein